MLKTVLIAEKSDKKDILRFYKSQHYSAKFIGQDNSYFIKENNNIFACLILSNGKNNNEMALLHALVVDKAYHRQGYASLLLKNAVTSYREKYNYMPVVCFADSVLTPFYLMNGFSLFDFEKLSGELPLEFKQRFLSYKKKQHTLCCFINNN